jgi:hypothetical protein
MMALLTSIVRTVADFLATAELLGVRRDKPSQNHRWRFY